jgi:hypothetical protein
VRLYQQIKKYVTGENTPKFYRGIIIPVLIYGSENQDLIKILRFQVLTAESVKFRVSGM